MSKNVVLIIAVLLIVGALYFILPHLFEIIGWLIGRIVDLAVWVAANIWSLLWWIVSNIGALLWFAISIILEGAKVVVTVLSEFYIALLRAYPLISIGCFCLCFVVVHALRRILSRKINLIWLFILAPIFATIVGNIMYGGGALKLDISISDAGLILGAVCLVFGIYYALIKSGKLRSVENANDAVGKILNYSFIVVLTLMVGGFGIAFTDKIVPSLVRPASPTQINMISNAAMHAQLPGRVNRVAPGARRPVHFTPDGVNA